MLIDTKGPEIRTTSVAEPIKYKTGDIVKVFGRPDVESTHDIVNLSYKNIASDVKEGDHLLFDDGAIDMEIIESAGPMLVAKVTNDGELGSRKKYKCTRCSYRFACINRKGYYEYKVGN